MMKTNSKNEVINKKGVRIKWKCKNICKENFENKYVKEKRDECHYTGEYESAAHSICNLKK